MSICSFIFNLYSTYFVVCFPLTFVLQSLFSSPALTLSLLLLQFHRTCLPAPMFSRNDVSIWSILKKCIGMVRTDGAP